MFIIKLIRKAGKFVRGGASPAQIAMGAVLGVLIGFLPGLTLTLLLAIAALVVLNAHLGTALIGIGLGKVCALLLAPVSFRIGYFIIHGMGLERFFARVVNAPVLALAGFERYSLTGAFPLIALVGGLYAYFMIKGIGRIRTVFFGEGKTGAFVGKIAAKKPVAVLVRIFFGKKKDLEAKKPLLRKSGVVALCIVALTAGVLDLFALNAAFRWGAVYALERLNGAEVNLQRTGFSLLRGRCELVGLEMTDPEQPLYNRFQTGRATADLSIRDLLARRLVIRELHLSDLHTNVERAEAGEIYEKEPPPPEPEPDPDEPRIFDYFQNTENIEKVTRWTFEALERQRERNRRQEETMEEPRRFIFDTAENIGYRNTSADMLLREYPALSIQAMEIGNLNVFEPLKGYTVAVTNLSSNPLLSGNPTEISLLPGNPEQDDSVRASLNLHKMDTPHEVRANITGIPVGSRNGIRMSDAMELDVSSASAGVSAEGDFLADHLDIAFTISISEMDIATEEGKGLFGLDADTSELALSLLDHMKIYGALYGQLRSPRVSIDSPRTRAGLRENLRDIDVSEGLRTLLDRKAGEIDIDPDGLRDLLDRNGEEEDEDGILDMFRRR